MLRAKLGWCLPAMVAVIAATDTPAWAVDASDVLIYSVGPVRIKPHVNVAEQYDDNVFRSPNNATAEDDFITIVSPGVNLQLGRREANHIVFDYEMEQALYARRNTQDHLDHNLSLDARIARDRVTLEGQTGVQFLSGVLGGGFNQPGQRVDRVTYQDSYRVDYAIGAKTSAYVVGRFNATDYASGTFLYDENDLRGTGGFEYRLTSKTSFFGELYYGQTATSPNASFLTNAPYSFVYGGFAGVSGDFTARLRGSVRAGYEAREFGGNTPGSQSPVVEVSLTDRLSPWTTVSLIYSRRTEVSVQVGSQAYASDSINARVVQLLTSDGKLSADIGGALVNSEYEDNGFYAGRHDVDIQASLALIYRIQPWLSTRLAYQFEKFNSDNNTIPDYDVNRVTVGIAVGF